MKGFAIYKNPSLKNSYKSLLDPKWSHTTTINGFFNWKIHKKNPHLDMCTEDHLINLDKSIWTYLMWLGGLFEW
jgi:hypothetical protein